jgi:hypothetical protein
MVFNLGLRRVNLLPKDKASLRLIKLAHCSVPNTRGTLARACALALLPCIGIHYVDRDLSVRIIDLASEGLIHVGCKLEKLRIYHRVYVAASLWRLCWASSKRPLLPLVSGLSCVVVNRSPPSLFTSLIRCLDRCDTLDVKYYIQVEVVNLNRRAASIVNAHRRLLNIYWSLGRQLLNLRASYRPLRLSYRLLLNGGSGNCHSCCLGRRRNVSIDALGC